MGGSVRIATLGIHNLPRGSYSSTRHLRRDEIRPFFIERGGINEREGEVWLVDASFEDHLFERGEGHLGFHEGALGAVVGMLRENHAGYQVFKQALTELLRRLDAGGDHFLLYVCVWCHRGKHRSVAIAWCLWLCCHKLLRIDSPDIIHMSAERWSWINGGVQIKNENPNTKNIQKI